MTFLHMFPDSFLHMFFLMAALCTQNSPQDFIRLFRVSPSCGCGGRGWGLGESSLCYQRNWLVAPCCYFIICFIYYQNLVKNLSKNKNKWQQRDSNLESLRICHSNFRYHTCFEQGVPWHSSNCRVYIHFETHTWHDNNGHTVRITNNFLDILSKMLV